MYMSTMISDNINNMYYNNCDLAWKNHTCCAKLLNQQLHIYICYMVISYMIIPIMVSGKISH